MQEFSEISIQQVGLKWRSKKEVYNLLTTEGGCYLPPLADSHYKYISQILVGDKKVIKWKDVKVCSVPHLKGLTIKDLLEFARTQVEVDIYIPDYEYDKTPNRNWIWNVINTLCQEEFQKFIDKRLSESVKHRIRMKSFNIKALPEFINIFQSSKNISTDNGRSHFLLKTAGKRKWEEVKKDDEELLRDTIKENKLLQDKIAGLQNSIAKYEANQEELLADRGKLWKLYEEGIVDSDGEYKLGDDH